VGSNAADPNAEQQVWAPDSPGLWLLCGLAGYRFGPVLKIPSTAIAPVWVTGRIWFGGPAPSGPYGSIGDG
jgi:hypothetical protein